MKEIRLGFLLAAGLGCMEPTLGVMQKALRFEDQPSTTHQRESTVQSSTRNGGALNAYAYSPDLSELGREILNLER